MHERMPLPEEERPASESDDQAFRFPLSESLRTVLGQLPSEAEQDRLFSAAEAYFRGLVTKPKNEDGVNEFIHDEETFHNLLDHLVRNGSMTGSEKDSILDELLEQADRAYRRSTEPDKERPRLENGG